MKFRYAEDMNYWDTTVHPARSQGEIVELLENFHAETIAITQGTSGEKYAWLIRFQWEGNSYRFVFTPLPCRHPQKIKSFGGRKRSHIEQSRYQMARIANYYIKAILTTAEIDSAALFGFIELPGVKSHGGGGGLPYTAAELNVKGLTAQIDAFALLPENTNEIDGEYTEI